MLIAALTGLVLSAPHRAGRGAANPPGVSAEEDNFRLWNDPEITCQQAQNNWQICTNENDPNHLGTMYACPVTCALARGEEVEATLLKITNLDCPRALHKQQSEDHPDWWYPSQNEDSVGGDKIAQTAAKQPLGAGWEPILEEQVGCNGLGDGELKEFSFLVVLDASWVQYYYKQKAHFATQGYHTLETSADLMFDRVSYLYEAQFGVRLRVGKVYSFPELGEACATNHNNPDDGTNRTSTTLALQRAGWVPSDADAGVIRLGASKCMSASPISGLCSGTVNTGLTVQEPPFFEESEWVKGDVGRLNHRAMGTLAHELGHFFGLCGGGVLNTAQCLEGHVVNEIPDIMMAGCVDGQCGSVYGEVKQFAKFLPTCTPLYERLLCRNVRRVTCGTTVKVGSDSGPAVTGPTYVTTTTKATTATTPAPSGGVGVVSSPPPAGYEQQDHLSNKYCNGVHAASNKGGNTAAGEYSSRQACADACTTAAECEFFLWKACAEGDCSMRYHCARWHTATACDTAHNYNDGDASIIFKKIRTTDGGGVTTAKEVPTTTPTAVSTTINPPTTTTTTTTTTTAVSTNDDGAAQQQWEVVYASGSYGAVNVGESDLNTKFNSNPVRIIKRLCAGCPGTAHKEIFYRRYTETASFSVYSSMLVTWSETDNVLGVDFDIFSTLADAEARTNAWAFCNYGDQGIGFPRDCGPSGGSGGNWNSLTRGGQHVEYSIRIAPSLTTSTAATTNPKTLTLAPASTAPTTTATVATTATAVTTATTVTAVTPATTRNCDEESKQHAAGIAAGTVRVLAMQTTMVNCDGESETVVVCYVDTDF